MSATVTLPTPSPLPRLDSPEIQKLGWSEFSPEYSTYAKVLDAEMHVMRQGGDDQLIAVKVSGYMFLEFANRTRTIGTQPITVLTKWFTSPHQDPNSTQHDVIIECGEHLRDKFIRMFRTDRSPYSEPSSHPSRPSFDTLEDMIKDSLEPPDKTPRSARDKVLARERFRCPVTGIWNESSLKKCRELYRGVVSVTLEVAHIFNEGTMQNIDPAVSEIPSTVLNKTHAASGALAVLEMFGMGNIKEAFHRAGGVHQPWNMLALQHDMHTLFDSLGMWFEDTEKENCYKVCTYMETDEELINGLRVIGYRASQTKGTPILVEFNAPKKPRDPLAPSPQLLALHAACARVAHMSGAAEFFDRIERDAEETRVLASDGSSAPLLINLLSHCSEFCLHPTNVVIPGVARSSR